MYEYDEIINTEPEHLPVRSNRTEAVMMKQRRFGLAAVLFAGAAFLVTTPVFGMNCHDHGGHSMEHGQSGMIMLGEEDQEGIKAMFHLMPVDRSALPADSRMTHHLMVMLNDSRTGKTIEAGVVAVKVTSPDGKESAPVKLVGMQGHFGADVTLDQPGIWHFRVAAKPGDDKVRQYHTHYVVK